ncbi:MAG: MFS transporter [Wenzhouxiangellaceae bacterium]|nr:MFS transporter [Wenzhouxiangellaceae bacterium]
MNLITPVLTLLLGVAVILAGNGLLGSLLGVRGQLEQLSSGVLGVIMAGYFVGFLAGTFAIPRLIQRVGHIRTFTTLASLASITALVHGLYVHAPLWFVLRVASGFCVVGLYIVIESWLNERTDNAQRGLVFSVYMTTTLIGLAAGQLMLMAGDVTRLELFATASVLLSLGLVPVALTDVHEPTLTPTERLGPVAVYRRSPLGVVGCIFAGASAGAFWGLGPVFASALGLDTRGIAIFMALTILGGILLLWPIGRISDRFPRRTVLAINCTLASLGATAAAVLAVSGTSWVIVAGMCWGGFGFALYALAAAHTNDHFEREDMLEVTATLQLLWASGAIAGPILAGQLMQSFGPEALMYFIALTGLLPAIFARYRMSVAATLPVEQQGEFVPQFATSPTALEMLPEDDDPGNDEPAVAGPDTDDAPTEEVDNA